MDNNYLFLAMQTGGQLTPEQLQRAQQMGQLPQMNMGAGLNDIQKKNMQEAQHYSMFQRGGQQQEEVDQQYLSPYSQYNDRVSEFLQNLRATSMDALQDEMVGVNDDYAQEADEIEMEQAQYGQQVSQSTVNPQGLAAVNAWTQAAQNTQDLTKPVAQTAGLMSGLKGYFGDQSAYEANPYNSAWNPTRLTVTDMGTGEKTVTRAGRDGFEDGGQYFQPGGQYFPPTNPIVGNLLQGVRNPYNLDIKVPYAQNKAQGYDAQTIANAKAMGWGDDVAGYANSGWGVNPASLPKTTKKKSGSKTTSTATTTPAATTATTPAATTNTPPAGTVVVKNADGTESSISPEEAKKREEVKKAEEGKKNEENKTTTTKQNTGEVDYLAMLADPTGQNAGGVYRTDRNGNPVPMAFYDPNMRLTGMSADYRNNAASWFRKNKKPGQLKSVSFDFTRGNQSPATQVPNVTLGPNPASSTTAPTVANNATTPTGNQSAPSAQAVPNQTSRFFPQAPQPTTGYPGGPFPATDNSWVDQQWKEAAANWRPGMQWNGPQNMLPSSIRQTPKAAPGSATQSMIAPSITPGMQNVFPYAPVAGPTAPVQPTQPSAPQPQTPKQIRKAGREERRNMIEEANRRAIEQIQNATQGYAYGGSLYKAQVGTEVLGLPANPQFDTTWAPVGQTNVEMSQEFNKQKYGEPLKIDDTDKFRATYDKNKKSNPFFAPAMLAGLNTIAGAAQNADAKRKEKELRGKLSYDQIYSANPETSGNRGDWTFNEGYFRPNDMVPTQFTGAGRQMQWGGAFAEGDELYLDEDAIQEFLAAGGQLDYLD